MKRFVIVRFLADRWPTEVVQLPEGIASGDVVEKMQRAHRARFSGVSDSVKWKVHEGDMVSGMIEAASF